MECSSVCFFDYIQCESIVCSRKHKATSWICQCQSTVCSRKHQALCAQGNSKALCAQAKKKQRLQGTIGCSTPFFKHLSGPVKPVGGSLATWFMATFWWQEWSSFYGWNFTHLASWWYESIHGWPHMAQAGCHSVRRIQTLDFLHLVQWTFRWWSKLWSFGLSLVVAGFLVTFMALVLWPFMAAFAMVCWVFMALVFMAVFAMVCMVFMAGLAVFALVFITGLAMAYSSCSGACTC